VIGKIIKGKGFGGAVRYAMQKDLGEARLIGTNLVADRNDADALAAEMAEHAAMLRPDVKKAVQHVSLSAAPGEHLTDEQWRRVAEAYMEKMGFKDNQHVLVRHADTGHDHVHLILNRVSMSGDLASTQYDYRRQEIALDRIEREHGLVRTHEQLAAQMRAYPEQAIDALLRNKTSFTERDLKRHFGRALRDDAEIERAVERVLKDERCLIAGERGGLRHFTSQEVLAEQAALRGSLGALLRTPDGERRGGFGERFSGSTVALSAEQRAAVESITGERHLSVVSGYAGAGKSTMLHAARLTWEAQGKQVLGCALAGKAAKGLEESSGIASDTLAKRMLDLEKGRLALTRESVVVVDEAGMVENRQMAQLAKHCADAGASLVLVGDDRQLRPIGRGGAFNVAREMAGETAIESVRRQRLEWQREASKAFGRGEAAAALGAYVERERIEWAASRGSARSALVRDYAAAVEQGGDTGGFLVLAHRRRDVAELNAEIRSRLKAQGRLGEERHYELRQGERRAEIDLAAGDRIVCTQNDRQLGVKNGSFGTVLELGGESVRVRLDDGAEKSIDLAEYGHLEHGYASTVHKAQGATVERTFVLATPAMDAHLSYVALSRHQEDTTLYAGRADFEDEKELVRRLGRESDADYFADFDEEGGRTEALERGHALEPEDERSRSRGLDLEF
jgi:Ti-type conjugative transfer relaxase TraA